MEWIEGIIEEYKQKLVFCCNTVPVQTSSNTSKATLHTAMITGAMAT